MCSDSFDKVRLVYWDVLQVAIWRVNAGKAAFNHQWVQDLHGDVLNYKHNSNRVKLSIHVSDIVPEDVKAFVCWVILVCWQIWEIRWLQSWCWEIDTCVNATCFMLSLAWPCFYKGAWMISVFFCLKLTGTKLLTIWLRVLIHPWLNWGLLVNSTLMINRRLKRLSSRNVLEFFCNFHSLKHLLKF